MYTAVQQGEVVINCCFQKDLLGIEWKVCFVVVQSDSIKFFLDNGERIGQQVCKNSMLCLVM